MKLPVTAGSNHSECVINRKETQEGVSLARSLMNVAEGQVVKRILNTTRTGDLRRGDRAGRQGFFNANDRGKRQENFGKIET